MELLPNTEILNKSSVYETKPYGYTEQADFLNMAVEINTVFPPDGLLGACLGIEAALGRVRLFQNGPRIIDLDVLLAEHFSSDTSFLRVPHPEIQNRSFVLQPLYDLFRPDYEVLVHDFKVAEIVPKGCHKAKGMERMCAQVGIDIHDSIAVGDSINDVDMLRAAGIGICMGNGTEIAKKNADYITKDLYDDGIYHALRHFGLF